MTRARSAALGSRLYAQTHPGLPDPVVRVPFGQDCPWNETFGLPEAHASIVVALVAAEFTGMGPVTREQLEAVQPFTLQNMPSLERSGWVECVGLAYRTRAKLWKPTARAWRELGLVGWSLLKEVA